jgi:hypothetical protein
LLVKVAGNDLGKLDPMKKHLEKYGLNRQTAGFHADVRWLGNTIGITKRP